MGDDARPYSAAASLDIPLDRDLFMRAMVRELAGTLEQSVGLERASSFFSIVGQAIGDLIDGMYKQAWGVARLGREQVAEALVDLKARILGGFRVVDQSDDKIVLVNTACPFGEKVLGRRSMCMMTSNVFGSIAAENLGYAKVSLEQTIAEGRGECHVTVYLQPGAEADAATGHEYFRGSEDAAD